jgi:energy-coupling factor transporter ATP-binding protein EcfA2
VKVIQIKGTNGSGKTTLVKQLIDVNSNAGGKLYEAKMQDAGKEWVYATYMQSINWAVVGEYQSQARMGGCDLFPHPGTVEYVKQAISAVVETTPNVYGLIFEGMMVSTIISTFYNFLLDYPRKYNVDPLFIILTTTLEGCLNRIETSGRLSKPTLNIANIEHKARTIMHGGQSYDQRYVGYMNVERIALKDMLPTLLYLVDDNDLLEYMEQEQLYGSPNRKHSIRHL